MKRRSNHYFGLASAILFGFGLMAHVYGNIVLDGDFEAAAPTALSDTTTDFTLGNSIDGGHWTVGQGIVGVDMQNVFVYAGNKSIFLNGSGSGPDSLRQTLTTAAGLTYAVSFWANADVANTLSVTLGGAAMAGAPTSIAVHGFPNSGYLANSGLFTFYSGTSTATSPYAALVFTATGFSTGTGVTVEIDNVSVTVIPEPSMFALTAIGAIGGIACAWRRRRRQGCL
jgi:hypothetical protein